MADGTVGLHGGIAIVRMEHEARSLRAGRWTLENGATGGVGSIAPSALARLGHHVVALDREEKRVGLAEKAGREGDPSPQTRTPRSSPAESGPQDAAAEQKKNAHRRQHRHVLLILKYPPVLFVHRPWRADRALYRTQWRLFLWTMFLKRRPGCASSMPRWKVRQERQSRSATSKTAQTSSRSR